jgi:hypothetical protein
MAGLAKGAKRFMSTPMPKRGFTSEEFARRTERAQAIMAEHELTHGARTRPMPYFSGFDCNLESPMRPRLS